MILFEVLPGDYLRLTANAIGNRHSCKLSKDKLHILLANDSLIKVSL